MGKKLQFKRGPKANLPTLSAGEPAYVTDEARLYIGDGSSNHGVEMRIADQSAKSTPVDADSVVLVDSADSSKTKRLLWSKVKEGLGSVYAAVGHTHAWSAITGKPSTFTPAGHTHAASDITIGTLPIVRGGTGASDAAGARANLGAVGTAELAAYDKTVKATHPVATGQSITAGDVVDVVGGEVTVRKVALSAFSVGTIIRLNENGSPVNFYIAKFDYESALNGTGRVLLVRASSPGTKAWNSTGVSTYPGSTVDTWLNGDYKNSLDADVKAAMGTTSFYNMTGNGSTTLNAISKSVFLLATTEFGIEGSPAEGPALAIASTLRGLLSTQWSRTPDYTTKGSARTIMSSQSASNGVTNALDVLPTFTLPSDFMVPSTTIKPSQAIALTTATAGQSCEVIYSGVASLPTITEGQAIQSDGVYGVGVLPGVLQVWSKDRPGLMVTGSYVGDGTFGKDNPITITLPGSPKMVFIELADGTVTGGSPYGASVQFVIKALDSAYKSSSASTVMAGGAPGLFPLWSKFDNGVLSFYSVDTTRGKYYQLNNSDKIYHYVILY